MVVLVAIPVVLLGAPAHADHPGGLLVSTSSAGPFRQHLATSLFAADGPFVPGDRATARFYVKNASTDLAHTTLALVDRGGRPAFESALGFQVRLGATAWDTLVPVAAGDATACRSLARGPDVPPAGVQPVELAVEVADVGGQGGMGQRATLDFVVTLTGGPGEEASRCGDGGGGGDDEGDGRAVVGSEDGGGGDVATTDECDRAAVISLTGPPTCVPRAVEAGEAGGGTARPPALAGLLSVLLLAAGAGLTVWGGRRRRAGPPAIPA